VGGKGLTEPCLVVVQVVEVHVVHDTVVAILINVVDIEQGPEVAMFATKGACPLRLTGTTRTPNHQHLGAQRFHHLLIHPLPHLRRHPDELREERLILQPLRSPVLVSIVLQSLVLDHVLVGRVLLHPKPELFDGPRIHDVAELLISAFQGLIYKRDENRKEGREGAGTYRQ